MSGFQNRQVVERAVEHSQAARQTQLQEQARDLGPVIGAHVVQRHSWRMIAILLNEEGLSTLRGKPWTHRQAKRVWDRYRALYPSE